jgi:hypothetical protein
MARALINVPRKARRGEVIEIKTLVSRTRWRPDIAAITSVTLFRATSSAALRVCTMERKCSGPIFFPQLPPIPSCN